MNKNRNIQVRLASRPRGWPQESDFHIVEEPVPAPGSGELVVRNHYLSLDPYMRGRMSDAKSYVAPVELEGVMPGATVAEVIASNHPQFEPGDYVTGDLGWQLYTRSNGQNLRKIDVHQAPLTAYLGAAGMPGVTAYCGLLEIGQPKPGETVVVSAAAGAVGTVVGQIAKIKGCRAVGIAGGAEKCRFVVDELGFDACIDYKSADFRASLKAAVPKGVDVYFDNVGGEVLDEVLARMNPFSRLPLCGLISQYNATEPYGVKNFRSILVNRIRVQGFIVFDYAARWREALTELSQWIRDGKLKYRETIAQGIEAAPRAFIGMLHGENIGKQLVKLV
ncbi:MAG: NADP-dependent oxidoreductase [Steroidobacteraceae bacterium]